MARNSKSDMNASLGNVPSVNIGEAVMILSEMYCSVIRSGLGAALSRL